MLKRLFSIICALLTALMPMGAGAQSDNASGFELHVIDVGKADCLLIKCDGENMLIDTGYADSEDTIRAYLSEQGVTRLEYLVATHQDKDHIGGMPWVLAEYEIGTALICPLEEDSKPYMRMKAALSAEGTNAVYPTAGYTFTLGGANITVLSPNDDLLSTNDENECSIVLMVEYGSTRFLLMGDAQSKAEESLIKSDYDLTADVLKVGHHGSDQSTSPIFLSAVKPTYAAISCGYSDEDNYPAGDTLDALESAGVDILRTDADGTIIFTSDGASITARALGTDVAQKGYVLDTKKMIFHLTTCRELPGRKKREFYRNRSDVVDAGGVPCTICNP